MEQFHFTIADIRGVIPPFTVIKNCVSSVSLYPGLDIEIKNRGGLSQIYWSRQIDPEWQPMWNLKQQAFPDVL